MRTAAAYVVAWLVASAGLGVFYAVFGGLSPLLGLWWGWTGVAGAVACDLVRWAFTARDTGFPADDDPELLEPWISSGVLADGADRDPAPFRVTPDSRVVWNEDVPTVGFRPAIPEQREDTR